MTPVDIFGPGPTLSTFAELDNPIPGVQNPYWDDVREVPTFPALWPDILPEIDCYFRARDLSGNIQTPKVTRQELVSRYAWAIPSPGDIRWLTQQLRARSVDSICEIGAGSGYWAWQLHQAGFTVHAYDKAQWNRHYHPVAYGTPEDVGKHVDSALMLCWPPFGTDMAEQALKLYWGDTLIHVGEQGGMTADTGFFELLDAQWLEVNRSPFHVNYSGIRSRLEIYTRA